MSNFPAAGVYNIDATHSSLAFVVRHLVVSKVRGNFADFAGTVTVGDTPETSSVSVVAQAASITTNNADRDNHIKSPDFLDLENNPTLTFTSTSFTSKGGDKYALVGDLTIRGVTKSVEFDVTYNGAGDHFFPGVTVIGFDARSEIDRRDFNVNFEGNLENGNAIVGHKIELVLEIEAGSQADA